MKILHIQKVKGLAGSEKYFTEIFPRLLAHNVHCDFVCIYEKEHRKDVELFLEIIRTKIETIYTIEINWEFAFSTLWALRKIMTDKKYDAIHSHLIHADLWCASLKLLFRMKFKLISTKHGYDEWFINKYGLDYTKIRYYQLYFLISFFAEKFIDESYAVSEGLMKFFIQSNISSANSISYIHHGIEPQKLHYVPSVKHGVIELCIIGRLVPLKGHKLLFEALYKLKNEYACNFKLNILGTGYLLEELKELANKLGLTDNVVFKGHISDVENYIINADCIVFPSKAEGFGLAILEAFALGRPVIAFDVPACNEIIEDEYNGFLVKPFDTNHLAKAIFKMASNKLLIEDFGHNAFNTVKEKFTLDQTTLNTFEFYKRSLN